MPAPTQTTPSWLMGSTDDGMNGYSSQAKSNIVLRQGNGNVPRSGQDEDNQGLVLSHPGRLARQVQDKDTDSSDYKKFSVERNAFDQAWTDALTKWGEARDKLTDVFEALWREKTQDININIIVLNLRIQNDDYNTGVRCWNASIPDRATALMPLRAPPTENELPADAHKRDIGGLGVSIQDLEDLPDFVKAALLHQLGIDLNLIIYQWQGTELEEIKEAKESAGLLVVPSKRTPEQTRLFDLMKEKQDQSKRQPHWKRDDRLTKQLRVVMGLTPLFIEST